MMPYTPVDSLRAMHRESISNVRYPDDAAAARSPAIERLEHRPDPLGVAYEVALNNLRLGERLREGIAWFARLGKVSVRRPA